MTKHISTSNKVVECKADQKTCPRKHFESFVEAQTFVNDQTTPENISHRKQLIKFAAEYGINPNEVVDHTGQTLTQAWEKRIGEGTYDPNKPNVDKYIYNIMGDDFNWDGVRLEGMFITLASEEGSLTNNDENVQATSANLQTKLDQGFTPYIEVFTHNGRGNRECSCYYNEGHDPSCYGCAADRLEEHPLHAENADNEDDYTYASFFYKIPEEHLTNLKEVIENDEASIRHFTSDHVRKQVAKKEMHIVNLLNTNPEREKELEKLYKEQDALGKKKKELNSNALRMLSYHNFAPRQGYTPNWGSPTNIDSHVRALRDISESYKAGVPAKDIARILDGFTGDTRRKYQEAVKAKETIAKTEELVAYHDEVWRKLEQDNPAIAKSLKDSVQPKHSLANPAYRKAQGIVDRYENSLTKVMQETAKYNSVIVKMSKNKAKIDEVNSSLYWPGSSKTLPTLVEEDN